VNTPPDPDALIDRITGHLLRAGVVVSALVLLAGGAAYLSRHGSETLADQKPDLTRFEPLPARYSRPADILDAVRRGEARPLIQIGVILLFLTPLLRVLFTVVAFAWRREPVYVILPLIVLGVLAVGFWAGQSG
jgi:uncharacterized membrane protein